MFTRGDAGGLGAHAPSRLRIDAVFANIDWQAVEARMAPRTAVRRRAAR